MIRWLIGSSERRLMAARRALAGAQAWGWSPLARILANHIQRRYGVFLPHTTPVPLSVHFPHPTAIVIGQGVRLGEAVTIYQNVTLGGARRGDWQAGRYPSVGDGTTIFAGAVIAGPVTIGRDCTVGANAVVLQDVPDGATAVGNPARILPPKEDSSP